MAAMIARRAGHVARVAVKSGSVAFVMACIVREHNMDPKAVVLCLPSKSEARSPHRPGASGSNERKPLRYLFGPVRCPLSRLNDEIAPAMMRRADQQLNREPLSREWT